MWTRRGASAHILLSTWGQLSCIAFQPLLRVPHTDRTIINFKCVAPMPQSLVFLISRDEVWRWTRHGSLCRRVLRCNLLFYVFEHRALCSCWCLVVVVMCGGNLEFEMKVLGLCLLEILSDCTTVCRRSAHAWSETLTKLMRCASATTSFKVWAKPYT